jgi:hypothetical protein
MTLEQVLADWRESAQASRRTGHGPTAELVEKIVHDVEAAAEEYLRWLSEEDAMLRSGKRRAWLRARFAEWERGGNARRIGRKREYRMAVVPQGADTLGARDAGRQAGAERMAS